MVLFQKCGSSINEQNTDHKLSDQPQKLKELT